MHEHNNYLTDQKTKALTAGKKASGTLSKVVKMIEEDEYCPDIIQQIDAVIGLLKSTKSTLLRGHLDHCLTEQLKQDKIKAIEELLKIYKMDK